MRKRIIAFVIAYSLLLFILVLGQALLLRLRDSGIQTMDSGWEIRAERDVAAQRVTERYTTNGNPEKLRTYGMKRVKRGDIVTMETMIPPTADIPFPTLYLETKYAAVEVYVDNERIYDFETQAYEDGDVTSSGVHFINLPVKYGEGALKIVLRVGSFYGFHNIAAPQFGDYDSLVRAYHFRLIIPFMTGAFLVVFGASLIVMMTIYVAYLQRFETHIVTGILCVILGAWVLCKNRLTIFIAPSLHTTEWEYVCLYLIIPMLYVYLYGVPRIGDERKFRLIAGTSSGLCLVFLALHFAGLVHITYFNPVFYCLAWIGTVLSIVYLVRLLKQKRFDTSEGIRMAGLVAMSVMNGISVAVATLTDYLGIYRAVITPNLLPLGAAFFVLAQLVDYFIYVTSYYAKKEENISLEDIAFVDELTGLKNRAEWDKKMEQLTMGETDYCIFSMDLNGLKEVNDTAGHAAGDRLLKDFAAVLTQTFREEDFCARIGGDEFVVIMEGITEWQADTYVKFLDRCLKDLDRTQTGVNHSCACGYAFRKEAENPRGVFLKADAHMYRRKAALKSKNAV